MSTLNIEEIMKLLPHRYPFLLVDKIVECDDLDFIVGIKNVTINEPFFQGHFPGMPVMPGVLQLEAMAQVAGVLMIKSSPVAGGVVPYFMSIDGARFRRVVKPGDQLRIEIKITQRRSRSVKFTGAISVEGQAASEAEMMCMVVPNQAGA
jgi:beta-hydroxyacyl-ACP dehydratase FabZ